MLKAGIVWQEETFKIEKSRGCQGSFFVFSVFVFFWQSENLVLIIIIIIIIIIIFIQGAFSH